MIVVFGEALMDLVPDGDDRWRAVPGGGPANIAVALARLGTRTSLACRLSGDGFGRRLRAHLEGQGVDLSAAVTAGEPTTLAVVALSASGSPDFRFYAEGTADWQWKAGELPRAVPSGAGTVCFGALSAVLAPGAAVLREWASGAGAVVAYDINVRPDVLPDPAAYRAEVEAWLRVADVVKASAEDLAFLYGDRDPYGSAREWIDRFGCSLVLLTFGADGAAAVPAGGEPVRVPGLRVEVVDTVGAGDTFLAGVLHRLDGRLGRADLPEAELRAAVRFGVAASAITCTREGARPPDAAEVGRLLEARGQGFA